MVVGRIMTAVHVCAMLPILAFEGPPAIAEDYCITNSGAAAVDLSNRVNQEFLDKMKNVGVQTIIRYYDHEDETILGKTLKRQERDLIIALFHSDKGSTRCGALAGGSLSR